MSNKEIYEMITELEIEKKKQEELLEYICSSCRKTHQEADQRITEINQEIRELEEKLKE